MLGLLGGKKSILINKKLMSLLSAGIPKDHRSFRVLILHQRYIDLLVKSPQSCLLVDRNPDSIGPQEFFCLRIIRPEGHQLLVLRIGFFVGLLSLYH